MHVELTIYYDHIRQTGLLLTDGHARRWSRAVLNILGTALDRGTKKALGKALPDDLARDLNGIFWLLHFRNPQLTAEEFQNRVARRAGNSDAEFARYPTVAVFGAVKQLIDADLRRRVAETLSPEVRALWEQA